MEVAKIITSEKQVISLFDMFIYSCPLIKLDRKDQDTAFFHNIHDKKEKLYYHFKLDDINQEFLVNFDGDEVAYIKFFFENKNIYMFDLSYALEKSLTMIFEGFKEFILKYDKNLIPQVLIAHPFHGMKNLKIDY